MYICTAEPQGKRNLNEYFPKKRRVPTFYPVSNNRDGYTWPSNEMKLKYIVFSKIYAFGNRAKYLKCFENGTG